MLEDGDPNSEIFDKTIRNFNCQLLSILKSESGETPNYSTNSKACQEVWSRFSKKHQKSPTRVNNNVQKCYANQRLRSPTSCRLLFDGEGKRIPAHETSTSTAEENGRIHIGILHLMKFVFLLFYILKIMIFFTTALLTLYCVNVFHKPTQTFISRHTQDLIYPFMRTFRLITLPIIRSFPAFTDFYEESCLISNPFFAIDDVDCWPCETVRHIPDLTGFSNFSSFYHHSGIPFVVKDAVKSAIEVEDLRRIFQKSPDILSKLVDLNLNSITSMDKLFDGETNLLDWDDLHVGWKINRVTVARLLRDYFPKPYFIPVTTEVSVQHYLFLDNSKSPSHVLPITEFANVFLTQASGSRNLVLIPIEKCQQKCRVVSRILRPKDVLFYNWLFWRPMSVPVESSNSQNNTSVTYIGSFY